MSAGYLRRIDQRCQIELGFGYADACLVYPNAADRIVVDELERDGVS